MSLAKKNIKKIIFNYIIYSIILLVSTFIYERFSHGVTSLFMRLSFLFPLVLGGLLFSLFYVIELPDEKTISIWNMSLSTWVSGFILHGIFEIYGTEKSIVNVFFWVGGVLSVLAATLYVIQLLRHEKGTNKS